MPPDGKMSRFVVNLAVTLAFVGASVLLCALMWVSDLAGQASLSADGLVYWPSVVMQVAGYALLSGLVVDMLRGIANVYRPSARNGRTTKRGSVDAVSPISGRVVRHHRA